MTENKRVKFEKTALSSVINVRAIYTVHYFKYGQKFAFEGESHNFWELVYIDAGQAEVTAENEQFSLSQGEVYFHRPNEHHSIGTYDNFANSVIITFECLSPAMSAFEHLKFSLNDGEKSLLKNIVTESSTCFTDRLGEIYLQKMTKAQNAPFGAEQLIKSYIEQLLISVYRRLNYSETHSKPIRNSSEIAEKIKKILTDNVYGEVTLSQIANELFFSKTYVKSVFKNSTGQTIMQYFTSLKIEEAKKLISLGKNTFTEIAYTLGYSSLQYFSRQFRKYTGMSLTQYARSIKIEGVL